MALASIDAKSGLMAWLGIGNVQGVLVRAAPGRTPPRESLLVRSGVVGHRIPPLVPAVLRLEVGDVLALATDGIQTGFEGSVRAAEEVQAAATRILNSHGRPSDDALVVVVRYRGMPH